MNKRIVTAAITGAIHTPTMSPHLPITPDQIAEEAVRAYNAGAAVAHIHARDPQTGRPSADVSLFKEIASRVKSKCNIILCISTGGGRGMTVEERVRTIPLLKPELASCNFGSVNVALFPMLDAYKQFQFPWEQEFLASSEDNIFSNTFKMLRETLPLFEENGTRPEVEVYDVGMINNVAFMLNRGHLKRPIYIQFVMGILGGIQPTAENLQFLYKSAKDLLGEFTWSVCAAGKYQFPMCALSLILGGNVRVGLEDNLYLEKRVQARSNAEQVEKIIRIAQELGLEPASPDEARQILGLKGMDNVAF